MNSKDIFSFVIYMIHETAERWLISPSETYEVLKSTGCLDNLLVKHYEVLHTLGTQTVVDDIEEYVNRRRSA